MGDTGLPMSATRNVGQTLSSLPLPYYGSFPRDNDQTRPIDGVGRRPVVVSVLCVIAVSRESACVRVEGIAWNWRQDPWDEVSLGHRTTGDRPQVTEQQEM